MSKVLIFNKNIKKYESSVALLKSYYLDYLNFGLGLFDNYSIKELNFSFNYIKEDSGPYLSKLISHLKGIKTLNLSSTDLKSGASQFFIMLKNLYRKRKIKLENLFLNKCNLDDTSFYELGELLKSKYCKLKRLYLGINNYANSFNFLKKIKINKSLQVINFTKGYYGNEDVDDINRIINCTNIKCLHLSKNRINNFNKCLKVIYRTKLINEKQIEKSSESGNSKKEENSKVNIGEKGDEIENIIKINKDLIIGNFGMLTNLDISNNEGWIVNKKQINLIHKLIYETTLSCLDISHILFGPNPDKARPKDSYKDSVLKIKQTLIENKKLYKRAFRNQKSNKVDIKNIKKSNLEDKEIIKEIQKDKYKNLRKEIDNIIEDENAIYQIFLIKTAKTLFNNYEKYKNKDIGDKGQLPKEENSEKNKNYINDLTNYLKLKRAEKELINNNKVLNEKKLILI